MRPNCTPQACVYLEDARPANDRALEVPREMKLSLLRWDCPEEDEYHGQEGAAAAAAASTRSETSTAKGDGGRRSLGEGSGDRGRGGGQQQQSGGAGISGGDEWGACQRSAEGRSDDDE